MSKLVLHTWNFGAGSVEYAPPEQQGLSIVYEDEDLLAVDKPAGLLSVPGKGADKQDSMIFRVQQEYPEALIVHRLDMETSGLLLMARNKTVHRKLGMLFQKRNIQKTYVAVVHGRVPVKYGVVDLPLLVDWEFKPRQRVDFLNGKTSQTGYQVIEYGVECSRVELFPFTGRTHQLRLHMHSIGHSIIGDRIYSTEEPPTKKQRLLLHARALRFVHPRTREPLTIECPEGI